MVVTDVDSSDLRVDSSLLTIGGVSGDMPAVVIEVLVSSGEGIEVDTSVLLGYSVEKVVSISDIDVSSVGVVSGTLDDVSGISLSVRKVYVSISVLVVPVVSLTVDTTEEGIDSVKVEMEDDVEGTSVDIVSVKPEEVTSGTTVETVSPNDVNLEDRDIISEAEVSESECISRVVDSDTHGDVCKEGTRYVDTSEVILVSSVESIISVSLVGIAVDHVTFMVTNVEGTSVMNDGVDSELVEGSSVVMDGWI
jgi:hypothetical protein